MSWVDQGTLHQAKILYMIYSIYSIYYYDEVSYNDIYIYDI